MDVGVQKDPNLNKISCFLHIIKKANQLCGIQSIPIREYRNLVHEHLWSWSYRSYKELREEAEDSSSTKIPDYSVEELDFLKDEIIFNKVGGIFSGTCVGKIYYFQGCPNMIWYDIQQYKRIEGNRR